MDEHDTYINRTLRVILRSLLKPNDGYVELSKALKRMSEQRISAGSANSCADLNYFRSVLLTFKKIWGFLVNR